MSNKPLASSRTRFLSACHYLAISLLMFGFVPGVWAQPANNTWDTTISFNQTSGGILDLSSTFPGDSVSLNVSMSGAGVNTANADIGGGFDVASYFDVFADVTIPNSVNYLDTPISGPFSITQPVGPRPWSTPTGTDPGLTLTAPTINLPGDPSSPPFYALFPPASDTVYTGLSFTNTSAPHFFQYGSHVLYVQFTDFPTLILGTEQPVVQTGDSYSYSYTDSELELPVNLVDIDPEVDFFGTVTITTTVAAPDSSPGLAGILALLAVCAGGAWQKALEA